jgi:hypothetical protein
VVPSGRGAHVTARGFGGSDARRHRIRHLFSTSVLDICSRHLPFILSQPTSGAMDTSITSSYVRAKSSSVKSRPAEDRALIQTKKNKHASVHEEDENTKQNPSKRRKTTDAIPKRMKQLGQLTMDADAALGIGASSTAKTKRKDTSMVQEKRLRMWRKAPSQRFLEKLDRALTQRYACTTLDLHG